MNISDILKEPLLVANLHGADKEGVLRELAEHLCDQRPDLQAAATDVFDALLRREHLGSTGIGDGVAIPHAKVGGLDQLIGCFGRASHGVPFGAIDLLPVRLIFVLLVPENSAGAHLKALARISRLLKKRAFRDQLMQLPDPPTLYRAFVEEDARQ